MGTKQGVPRLEYKCKDTCAVSYPKSLHIDLKHGEKRREKNPHRGSG